ncbi:MAG TPA: hypothetical protein EYQ69_03100 [Gemmatimonadetes bacterium]|nr:hypothetical protein [Gemmatimonadota bacterium]
MEFLADLFWTGLIGFWIINQFRSLKKRQATVDVDIIPDQRSQRLEKREKMQLAQARREQMDLVTEVQNYFGEPDNWSEPWEIDPPLVGLEEEPETVQLSRFSKRSNRDREAPRHVSEEGGELGSTGEEAALYVDATNMGGKNHPLTPVEDPDDRLLPDLLGGEIKQLQRAIVLSEVLRPPVSMRKPEEQFSMPKY